MHSPLVLGSQAQLLECLLNRRAQGKEIVFLVGSPVADPVPRVNSVVELAGERLSRPSTTSLTAAANYQETLQDMLLTRDAGTCNAVIRDAVLQARDPEQQTADLAAARSGDDEACKRLEQDLRGWQLGPAVSALGEIVARHKFALGRYVLTTNFDPLIEVAVRLAGWQSVLTAADIDCRFDRTHSDDACHVVHLHGYWRGSHTLHTTTQLQQPREDAEQSLIEILRNRVLVVVGYGGWKDVVSRALPVLMQHHSGAEIRWCFFESDAEQIQLRYPEVAGLFAKYPQQAFGYGGIDSEAFFPSLLERLRPAKPATKRRTVPATILCLLLTFFTWFIPFQIPPGVTPTEIPAEDRLSFNIQFYGQTLLVVIAALVAMNWVFRAATSLKSQGRLREPAARRLEVAGAFSVAAILSCLIRQGFYLSDGNYASLWSPELLGTFVLGFAYTLVAFPLTLWAVMKGDAIR